jgi:hypothetical protein
MRRKIIYLVQDSAFNGLVEIIAHGNKGFATIIVRAGCDNGEARVVK